MLKRGVFMIGYGTIKRNKTLTSFFDDAVVLKDAGNLKDAEKEQNI